MTDETNLWTVAAFAFALVVGLGLIWLIASESRPSGREFDGSQRVPRERVSLLSVFAAFVGVSFFFGGLLMAAAHYLAPHASGELVNLGMMHERQTGVIFGLGLAIIGTILITRR